ncbi:hypothetical protein ACLF9L_00570 [Helicobacter pylori]
MEFYKRVLKLHHFRNLGKNLPTELLLNSSFEKHGGLVVLVGENNVGKSNVLEALKAFNDTDIKLCNENDYFKAHESEDTVLNLEEETILDHKITGFSYVDLKIQSKEVNKGLKELSKTLISYPFEKHVKALGEQCNNIVSIPINNDDYSNICTFVSNFTNFIVSYDQLKPFLHFYKEKLKLSELVTEYANATNNLLFKELIKYISGNSEWIKTFCQHIKEIIKHNTPNKKYNSDDFFVMGEHKQNQLSKIYSYFKKLSENEIKTKDVEHISKKIKSLDEVFNTTDFNEKFVTRIEALSNEQSQERLSEFIKDIIKEIDEKYPINENFKQQFRTFRSNIISLKKRIKNSLKDLEKTRKDFKRKKESWIKEIENYCESEYNSEKESKINYDVLLDNIQQICKKYIASHVVNDASKDIKYMICQFYLEKMELLSNSKIRRYQYDDLLKSEEKSLWESIKTLDNESGVHLFPKNPKGIKEKFEDNKGKFKQSESVSEIIRHCRECNPYTAFQNLRNKVQFPLSGGLSHKFDELVPTIKEYKELKITDNDLKTTLFTFFDYSSPSEFNQSDWLFRNSLFRKIDFNSYDIWKNLNLDDKKDFAEILEYNMQLKMDSSIAKEFNELLAIAQDSPQDSYQLKIHVRHNNKFYDYSKKSTVYEIKLEIHDCRKSHEQNKPIILSQQSTGFQWAFNFMFGFLYNWGSHFSLNKNIIYILDNHPIVLTDDDRKCIFNQKATSERFKRANEEMHDPITILQLSDCDRHFKQIEDCFSTNDRKKYAKNKQMELAMAFKTRLLYSEKDDVVGEETKKNFLKLFEWIKERVKQPND